MIALHKKGSKFYPKMYRGLGITKTVLKVCMTIIVHHIKPWYDAQLYNSQSGFRKSEDCAEAIYNLIRIHQIYNRKSTQCYTLMIDIKAAYDWLVRK